MEDSENIKENVKENSNKKQKNKKNNQKPNKFKETFGWPLVVLLTALILSFSFGFLSELALTDANIIVAILVICVFMFISIVTDIIGVAVTAADVSPFRSMSARKIRGAKEAIVLIKNADKVASIIADILGDICGILSGAAGAVVTAVLVGDITDVTQTILIASGVSAAISGIIIFGKAIGKGIAIKNNVKIVSAFSKMVSMFYKKKK
jgi:CBS domain containing-hemolysin-like protein